MMKSRSIKILASLVIMAAVLSACGPQPTLELTATPTSEPPATVPPIATPEPTETSTPTPTPAPVTFKDIVVPHTLEDRAECDSCHGQGGAMPFPDDHIGRLNEVCLFCHLPADTVDVTPDVTVFSQVECLICHGPFEEIMALNVEAVAEDGNTTNPHVFVPHDSKEILECALCHQPHSLPEPADQMDAAPVNLEACYECHHIRNFTDCHQCHPIIPIKD